MMISDSGLLF